MQAAVAVQQCVVRDFPALQVRVGLGVGDVSWEDGDCFGLPVVVAARLQAAAGAGQILVSSLVRMLAGDRAGAQFRPIDRLSLKGLARAGRCVRGGVDPGRSSSAEGEPFQVPLPSTLAVVSEMPFVGRDQRVGGAAGRVVDGGGVGASDRAARWGGRSGEDPAGVRVRPLGA